MKNFISKISKHNGKKISSIYPGFMFSVTGNRSDFISDENLKVSHFRRGMITLNNNGPNTNNMDFLVTFNQTPWLDGYHNVIGQIEEGESFLDQIEKFGSREGETTEEITISGCGEVKH